jgi:hypothetical protein
MDLRETEYCGVDWIHVDQDWDQWECFRVHGNETAGCISCWEILE